MVKCERDDRDSATDQVSMNKSRKRVGQEDLHLWSTLQVSEAEEGVGTRIHQAVSHPENVANAFIILDPQISSAKH